MTLSPRCRRAAKTHARGPMRARGMDRVFGRFCSGFNSRFSVRATATCEASRSARTQEHRDGRVIGIIAEWGCQACRRASFRRRKAVLVGFVQLPNEASLNRTARSRDVRRIAERSRLRAKVQFPGLSIAVHKQPNSSIVFFGLDASKTGSPPISKHDIAKQSHEMSAVQDRRSWVPQPER